ncbi:MAG: hypothetical protein KDB22_09630 [Planctomycetales bacterium]|nr:hypothetical protein [Planctomycetales bacterium]
MADTNDESLMSQLMRLLPGYGGYRDRESRREDDRITRQFLSQRLNDCKSACDLLGNQAVSAGNLELPSVLESVRARIEGVRNRLDSAVEGYSGWFTTHSVDVELLQRVCEADQRLVSYVDQIDNLLREIAEKSKTFDAGKIRSLIDNLDRGIDRRNEILSSPTVH